MGVKLSAVLDRVADADDADAYGTRDIQAKLLRDGYVSVDGITTHDDIHYIRSEALDLFAGNQKDQPSVNNLGKSLTPGGNFSILEIVSPHALRPSLTESLFFKRALHVSRAILGPSARLLFDHFISKPPFNGEATAWHQDCAHGPPWAGITCSARQNPLVAAATEDRSTRRTAACSSLQEAIWGASCRMRHCPPAHMLCRQNCRWARPRLPAR